MFLGIFEDKRNKNIKGQVLSIDSVEEAINYIKAECEYWNAKVRFKIIDNNNNIIMSNEEIRKKVIQ
jgi:hypothetical protein